MDGPAQQLHDELNISVKRALQTKRPILTHLNADTTWLIQLPWPATCTPPMGRTRHNILIDPWLSGPQSDVASWFSKQWHVIPSSVQTIAELDDRLKDIEAISQSLHSGKRKSSVPKVAGQDPATYIDAVAISHEFTDHLHQATLLELSPSTPIFATEKAALLIRSWSYFDSVHLIPPFTPSAPDWRQTSIPPLPPWLGISRVVSASNALYYHSALLFTFSLSINPRNDTAAEAIIYSPHGIHAADLAHLPHTKPPIKTLALMHGLHDVGIVFTKQLNLGAHNGLKAQRIVKAKYWVGTHDEVKKAGGILGPFLRREQISLQEAVAMEESELLKEGKEEKGRLESLQGVSFEELKSGESLLLL